MERHEIGRVTHFYSKISVAILQLDSTLKVGERIAIVGSTTDLEQDVKSMQVEHQNIEVAKAGDLVGLKVKDKVREGDTVFIIKNQSIS
jgi:translation elongation factor EF-1alpha